MNRRRFMEALGTASGASLAGCSDVEFDQRTPPDEPVERIRFLERERAALLYAAGVSLAAQGKQANDAARTASRQKLGHTTEAMYHGQASGLYDAAASAFDGAAKVLEELSDLPTQDTVTASKEARAKAHHLGLGNLHMGRAVIEAAGDTDVSGDGSGTTAGMRVAGREEEGDYVVKDISEDTDDGGAMKPANPDTATPTDDGIVKPDYSDDDKQAQSINQDPATLAENHFDEAAKHDIAPVEQLRGALGLSDG